MEVTNEQPESPQALCRASVDHLVIELQETELTGSDDNSPKAIVKETCSQSIENWLFYGKMEKFEVLCQMLIGNKKVVLLNRVMAILAMPIQLIFFSNYKSFATFIN